MTRTERNALYYRTNKEKIKKHNASYNKKWQRQYGRDYAVHYKQTIRGKWTIAKATAKFREVPFELSQEEFTKFAEGGCFVDGCNRRVSGLDRIDSGKGYILSNVRPSCERHNEMKNDMSDEETYHLAKEFVRWYEKRL